MSHKPLKLAFVGGGLHSAIGATHKIASQMDGFFRLEAGCFSRDLDKNRQTASAWGVERIYADSRELIEEEKQSIDALVVLTPTTKHTQVILDALQAAIPVISEKTLTHTLEDALKIHSVVKKKKGFLLTTYNYTGYPMIRELKAMIRKGRLGSVIQVNIQMPQESFIRLDKEGNIPHPQEWRLHDGTIPTLSLDLGTHLSNMVSFLTDSDPVEVVTMQNDFGHYPVVDNIVSMIRYTNGIDCHMWYGKSALGHKNGLRVEVYGTEGSASWYQMDPEFLVFNDNRGRNIVLDRSSRDIILADLPRYNRFKSGHPAGFIEAFANHYADIYRSLIAYKNGEEQYMNEYVFGIDASIRELALMQAIEASAKSKLWEPAHAQNQSTL